ncbi:MAG: alanine racemase [Chlamydiales bacterium 38-26]|nr:bifunctional UDP-N-acetylmuramoyl-tripeptide:D-alanyl-D-alanine ligase/alanine racemase [Chlamydiales bacterium]OJV07672.1 MAG: alanine racemase [Chlamydiales bacterium 38-26]
MDAFDLRLWSGFIEAGGDPSLPAIIDHMTIDSRLIHSPHSLFIALPGTNEDGHHYVSQAALAGAKYAIVRKDWANPVTPGTLILLRVESPLHAFQEIVAVYRHQLNALFIGITGTHGKTMVKDLLQAFLATSKKVVASPGSFNSQIGVPLSILQVQKSHEIALIEAAVSKKDEMVRLANMIIPHGCILTHLGKKHLNSFGDQITLTSETIKLMTHVNHPQWSLIPQSPLLDPYLNQIQGSLFFWNKQSVKMPQAYSISKDYSAILRYRIEFPNGDFYEGHTRSGFYYFLDLINITVKAAWILGITSQAIAETLKQYVLEPMRTEIWKSPIGTTFINDIYCSDPQSMDQALKYYNQAPQESRRVLIFGGIRGNQSPSQSEYRRVAHAIIKNKVQVLALVGASAFNELIEPIKSQAPQTQIHHYTNYHEALQNIKYLIKQNDFVLIKGDRKESLDSLTEIFNDSVSTNQCFINLAAIQTNIETIRKKIGLHTRLMVMVKAFAYGTDEIRIGKFLSTCGIDILGVSYVDEGVALKRAGTTQAIFVINAAIYEVTKVVKWELEVGVSEKNLIWALGREAENQNKKIKVHLHVDTGMSRLGCRPEEALELAKCINACPSLILEGVMTHFACSDNPLDDEFTLQQSRRFDQVLAELKSQGIKTHWIHASNSSAVMRFDFPQYNMARIGLAAYGLYCSEATKKAMQLRLSLTLVSRVVGINLCKAGDTISYGRNYRVERDLQKIAVLPIGYFDGLHRNYSGKGYVLIRGQKAPMVGSICMDFMMVDVTDIDDVSIGDSVLIFGEDEYGQYLPPENLALQGDSIVHELITCLGPRIQRVFISEEANQNR